MEAKEAKCIGNALVLLAFCIFSSHIIYDTIILSRKPDKSLVFACMEEA